MLSSAWNITATKLIGTMTHDMQGCSPFTYILLNLVRCTYVYLLFYLLLLTMVTRNTDIINTILSILPVSDQ